MEVIKISIIEELYYDNVSVQNAFLVKNRDLKKRMQVLTESENYLFDNLRDENLVNFKRFSEAWNFVDSETNKEHFCYGFRLGALIMMDILNGRITD